VKGSWHTSSSVPASGFSLEVVVDADEDDECVDVDVYDDEPDDVLLGVLDGVEVSGVELAGVDVELAGDEELGLLLDGADVAGSVEEADGAGLSAKVSLSVSGSSPLCGSKVSVSGAGLPGSCVNVRVSEQEDISERFDTVIVSPTEPPL